VEQADYDLKEQIIETYQYSYDSKGNIFEQKNITPRYYFYKRFTYNAANLKIKESTSIDRKDTTIKESSSDPTFEYDDKGNLVRVIRYSGKETYTYTYDAHGNWITKLLSYPDELRNGEPLYELTEREIKYW
jgi:YD repeat-containing protein